MANYDYNTLPGHSEAPATKASTFTKLNMEILNGIWGCEWIIILLSDICDSGNISKSIVSMATNGPCYSCLYGITE